MCQYSPIINIDGTHAPPLPPHPPQWLGHHPAEGTAIPLIVFVAAVLLSSVGRCTRLPVVDYLTLHLWDFGGPAGHWFEWNGSCPRHGAAKARRRGLDPEAYLTDIIRRLPATPATAMHTLTPAAWPAEQKRQTPAPPEPAVVTPAPAKPTPASSAA
jgi:hypothetical protein